MNPFLNCSDNESADDLDDDDELGNQTNDEVTTSKQMTDEEKRKRADELWADLCSSTTKEKNLKKTSNLSTTTNSSSAKSTVTNSLVSSSTSANNQPSKPDKIKLTKEYDFAGEKVKVEEEVDRSELEKKVESNSKATTTSNPMKRGPGLHGLVANLGKKAKLSTLGKTKLDWNLFKKEEGLEDDLKNHVKNKNSYVERQAFLQRTDLKQFELEKSVREKNRSLKN